MYKIIFLICLLTSHSLIAAPAAIASIASSLVNFGTKAAEKTESLYQLVKISKTLEKIGTLSDQQTKFMQDSFDLHQQVFNKGTYTDALGNAIGQDNLRQYGLYSTLSEQTSYFSDVDPIYISEKKSKDKWDQFKTWLVTPDKKDVVEKRNKEALEASKKASLKGLSEISVHQQADTNQLLAEISDRMDEERAEKNKQSAEMATEQEKFKHNIESISKSLSQISDKDVMKKNAGLFKRMAGIRDD